MIGAVVLSVILGLATLLLLWSDARMIQKGQGNWSAFSLLFLEDPPLSLPESEEDTGRYYR